jgi:predicted nucleic acid-binding protein
MSGEAFFDSNVLLYLLSPNSVKSDQAEDLIAGRGVVSVQVLNEFANVASRKFGANFAKVRNMLSTIREVCTVKPLDIQTHDLGLDIAERYKFSVYDSMLVAAALQAKCTTFYTEDLQDGQKIGGLTVRNPFRDP